MNEYFYFIGGNEGDPISQRNLENGMHPQVVFYCQYYLRGGGDVVGLSCKIIGQLPLLFVILVLKEIDIGDARSYVIHGCKIDRVDIGGWDRVIDE